MTLASTVLKSGFEALARPSGAFAMLALDQRVTLSNLFREAGLRAGDDALDLFRAAAVSALTPFASAVLLERGFLSRAGPGLGRDERCSLIVAADRLVQPDDEVVVDSDVDPVGAELAVGLDAAALKLLVVWRTGEANLRNLELARTFRDLAHERGMVAIVEGIVRAFDGGSPTAGDLIQAAASLSAESDLYKAQVPIHDGWEPDKVERLSREVSAACPTPWVVLSAGVPAQHFPELLAASCRGGASGFLAGRAIWGSALAARDAADPTLLEAGQQIRALGAIVDRDARPWYEATLTRLI